MLDAYKEYAQNAEKMVIACGDDQYTRFLHIDKPIFYYGLDEDNDIIAKNVEYKENGTNFEVFIEDNYYGKFELPFYGKHMLLDALAVISICYYERLDAKEVAKYLKSFKGARRRFEETIIGDTVVIDDYAHHPTEVKVTLKSVKQKYPNKKIVAVMQPHTFSRVKQFQNEYIEYLSFADYQYLLPIYPSRECSEDYPNINSELITKSLPNSKIISINDSDILLNHKGSVIVFMSPNDISKLENELKNKLRGDKI